jgi:4-phytase/acid phosphatase
LAFFSFSGKMLPQGTDYLTESQMYLKKLAWLLVMIVVLGTGAESALAQGAPASGAELKFVVIFSRHGVRSPTWTTEQLNEFSAEPWPDWGVPPGSLTPHGKNLMKLFGAYERAYLAQAGLLSSTGCADADRVHIRANTLERTLETARAMAEGMLPGCGVEVHSLPLGKTDPLFNPIPAGVGKPHPALAAAAVSGRIGGKPEALLDAYRPALETMQRLLLGCQPGAQCPPQGSTVKQVLLKLPAAVEQGKGDRLAEMRGPLATASTFAEVFLLQYTSGMAGKDLGWGRLTESNMREMMLLHTAYEDLLRRTPGVGRPQASNLLSHILKTIEQAIAGKPVAGAMGKPGDRALILVGHDTNIANMAGMLGLSWLLPGYQRDDTPPGGALVFELWHAPAAGEYTVRTYYMAQTLEQMRKALPVTLDAPPGKAAVFVAACSTAGEGWPCPWKAFQRALESAIDPAFVKP